VAAFFRATAALYRAEPSKLVLEAASLISVTIEKLGVLDAALSMIGELRSPTKL
jgi:hypothetical protein